MAETKNKKTTSQRRNVLKRRHIRFIPDRDILGLIDLNIDSTEFTPTIHGLVLEESQNGVSLVVLASSAIEIGDSFKVKIGDLASTHAVVRWRKTINNDLIQIGLELIE